MHPRPLAPADADAAVQLARAKLGKRAPIALAKLRALKSAKVLVRAWERALDYVEARLARPPKLQNTDGDELLMTVDHFAVEPSARSRIKTAIAALEGAESDSDDPSVVTFLREGNAVHASWDNTVIGRAVLSHAALRLESNSTRRADALRQRIEAACGPALRHRTRELSDPEALLGHPERAFSPGPAHSTADAELPPEAAALLRQVKERHYATWIDTPLPALGGKSPRTAVETRAGRERVDVLLRELEHREGLEPAECRADLRRLRGELGWNET